MLAARASGALGRRAASVENFLRGKSLRNATNFFNSVTFTMVDHMGTGRRGERANGQAGAGRGGQCTTS
eukprot:6435794-Prymnesium_polylepis.1